MVVESLQIAGISFMYSIKTSAMNLLVPLYNSPQRHYHSMDHIYFCLSKLDEYAVHKKDITVPEVEILSYSIWFHDAFYSPYPMTIRSNEEESAEIFKDWYINNYDHYQDTSFFSETYINILMTEKHLEHLDFKYKTTPVMLDIDLAGFARPFEIVMNSSEQIFKEYECLGLGKKVMLENRIKFLQALLSKSKIFYTDYFYNKYETIARENIQEVIIRSEFELSIL